jgi:hypothetical protein
VGFGKLNAQFAGNSLESKAENYRFIEPISDFDPNHVPPTAPIELKHLNYVEVDLSIEEMVITW